MTPDKALTTRLPHNLDAERALLGAMLMDARQIDLVFSLLPPLGTSQEPLFYAQKHQYIYEVIDTLIRRQSAVDMTIIADELSSAHKLEAAGGAAYMATLVDELYSLHQVPDYCRIVEQKWIARVAIRLFQTATDRLCTDGRNVIETIDKVEQRVSQLAMHTVRGDFQPISKLVEEELNDIDEIRAGRRDQEGLYSGFKSLDEYTLGFRKQEFVIVAGRPSVGKTSLAMDIASNIAMENGLALPVGVFSLEMSEKQLRQRMLAGEAQLPLNAVRAPRYIDQQAVSELRLAAQRIGKAQLYIDDAPGMTMREIRAKARRLKRRIPSLATLVIDHMTLIQSHIRDLRERYTEISHEIKVLARELDMPIIGLCQLTRGSENSPGKRQTTMARPKISDLRETGAWEEDADIIILVHRETRDSDKAEIIVGKNKNGRTGDFELAYCGAQTRFAELPE